MDDKDLVKLAEVDARCKSNSHQIGELKDEIKEIRNEQKAIYDIATSVKLIAQDMGAMKESISKMEHGQKEMATKVEQGQKEMSEKVDEKIGEINKKIENVDSKSKFDWIDFVKTKVLPVLFYSGLGAAIIKIVLMNK